MIITHFDKDHVGGADKILESVSVARVILPQYEKESKQYAQFMEALEQSAQTEREILPAGGEWSEAFGQTRLRVTAAERTASAAFLAACSPKIAFIPDSDEEAASPMVVAILKELGTDVHSGRDGDLVVVSDGKDVFVK